MEKIRQAIDTRLAGQHLPETVYDALCARPARRSRVRRAAALLAAVCVLGGATALAAARLFGMNVNGRELPPLEPMTMVETADTGGPADGTEQQAEGLDALSRALGVPFLTWLPDHTEWLEEAEFDGLLEGCKGDIYKMVQMAQYVCFKSDLYDHCEDICRYGTLDQLRDMGVYAIRESLADEILNDLSNDEDYAPTDDAKDTIISAIYATFEEKYGEDFADCADNFIQDNDDIAGRVNPCAMSVETVRAVYGMGFDAVFLNDWKKELAECDIDPEAVSVDSEAHDMENGRDGLDGNAPEKDAPEKDDRDAQPPVDTDNR